MVQGPITVLCLSILGGTRQVRMSGSNRVTYTLDTS